MKLTIAIGIIACLLVGCDADRLAKLEKENTELKAKIDRQSASENFDLQAKCSKDARGWFALNFSPRDKNTLLVDYTNHYNKKQNACFIVVQYNFKVQPEPDWHSQISLWNVYENNQYGTFDQGHYFNPFEVGDKPRVNDCLVYGMKCTSETEFNKLVWTYIND